MRVLHQIAKIGYKKFIIGLPKKDSLTKLALKILFLTTPKKSWERMVTIRKKMSSTNSLLIWFWFRCWPTPVSISDITYSERLCLLRKHKKIYGITKQKQKHFKYLIIINTSNSKKKHNFSVIFHKTIQRNKRKKWRSLERKKDGKRRFKPKMKALQAKMRMLGNI